VIRRALRPGDEQRIAELHRRVYQPEYGLDDEFVSEVRAGVEAAVASGWPRSGGGVWVADDGNGRVLGSLALTDEGGGCGRIRWFVIDPCLRGTGLGRSLLGELLVEARAQGLGQLALETFSSLESAARLYREAGFRLVWERPREDWGTAITYQRYELALR
jgi:ribosomal protein S18 acetylase RimI-like enzyme